MTRSGNPELDELIEAFIAQGSYTDVLGQVQEIESLRTFSGAHARCTQVSNQFAKFVKTANPALDVTVPWCLTPDDCGYHDRPIEGLPVHQLVVVQTSTGTFAVDFTAAQYGYTEFPLVQRAGPPMVL